MFDLHDDARMCNRLYNMSCQIWFMAAVFSLVSMYRKSALIFFEGKKICQRKFRVLGVHLTSLKVQTNYSSQKVMWWPVFVVLHLYCSALDLKWKNNSSISLNTNSRCAAEQQTKLIIFFNLNSTRDLKVSKHTKCVWVNFSKMFMLVLNIFHYQHFVALTIHAGRE